MTEIFVFLALLILVPAPCRVAMKRRCCDANRGKHSGSLRELFAGFSKFQGLLLAVLVYHPKPLGGLVSPVLPDPTLLIAGILALGISLLVTSPVIQIARIGDYH